MNSKNNLKSDLPIINSKYPKKSYIIYVEAKAKSYSEIKVYTS